jgi:hypothetical protein
VQAETPESRDREEDEERARSYKEAHPCAVVLRFEEVAREMRGGGDRR